MITKKGINASAGVAIGPAFVLDAEEFRISRRTIDPTQVPAQIRALDVALQASQQEVAELRSAAMRRLGSKTSEIFAFHEALIADAALRSEVVESIEKNLQSAAYAFSHVMNGRQQMFRNVNDPYLKERVRDLHDVARRVLRHILGRQREDVANLSEPVVIVAHDITPSQAITLDREHILGFAIDVGGSTSHMAIIARQLGIPTVVGLNDATSDVTGGETVIVDGSHGIVVVEPDEQTIGRYRQRRTQYHAMQAQLAELRDLPAVTQDGTPIELMANIEQAVDVRQAVELGAAGIGLYRTEFIYLQSPRLPTEEQQFEILRGAVRHAQGRPIVIRTLDLGADKIASSMPVHHDANPVLGLRSLRYCLQHLELFRIHLRAILRVSADGDVRVMFPMITTLMEWRQAKAALQDVREDLEDDGIRCARSLKMGIMVETPAAAMMSSVFAREVDFMSIGTNDLTQYTLAVDRGNERIAHLYAPHNPAVLRLIKEVIQAGTRFDTSVSLCGEMAGSPVYTELLIGLGLRNLSMTPKDVPVVKKITRMTSLKRCESIARKVLRFDSDQQVFNFLRDNFRELTGDVL